VDSPESNIGRGKAGLAECSGRAGKAQQLRGIAYTRQNHAARERWEEEAVLWGPANALDLSTNQLKAEIQKSQTISGKDKPMASEQINQPASTELAHHTPVHLARFGRPLAIATAIVFCISSVFPAVAAFVKDTEAWPKWWGVLDVVIAFVLVILVFLVMIAQANVTKQAEEASYRAYRVLNHGIMVMLVVFFLFGDRIVWNNCLTGFAWRTWLLFYALPAWLMLFRFGGISHVTSEPAADKV
jgi:hypothetical protein